jgi:hypothetical protein
LAGLSVAVLTFLPAWTWAGLRYAQLKRAPFEILSVSLGLDGHYAFVNLERRHESNRFSALVLDLDRHDWRLAGELDESAFVEERSYGRSKAFIETGCPSFVLSDRSPIGTRYESWDGRTACMLRVLEDPWREPGPAIGPSAADFGMPEAPSGARVSWAGLGHRLSFRGEKGKAVVLYRDPVSGLVLDRAEILAGMGLVHSNCEVRVRPGRWLVTAPGRLSWVDAVSAETEDAGCIGKGEYVGPFVTDGRLMLIGPDGVSLLDPETCGRTTIRVLSDRDVSITHVNPMPWGSPLSSDSPSVVSVNANASRRIALFDPGAGTIQMASTGAHFDTQLVGSIGSRAITVEDRQRIVSYDFEHERREVLFSVEDLKQGLRN